MWFNFGTEWVPEISGLYKLLNKGCAARCDQSLLNWGFIMPKIGSWTSTPPKATTFPHCVTYTQPSHNPPNTHTIPKFSTTKEDNVVSAANKARRVLFNLKRSFAVLAPSTFLHLYKIFSGHNLNVQPIPRRRAIGKGAEVRSEVRERVSACPI